MDLHITNRFRFIRDCLMIPYAIENIPIDLDDEIEDQGKPEFDLEGNIIDPNIK